MPQLDGSIYITQIFWLLVTFISFWLIMDRLIVPRISEKIEERRRKYDDLILKAEEINQKAQNTLKEYEDRLTVAKNEAIQQIAANEQELKELIAVKQEQMNESLKQKVAESESILQKERAETLAAVDEISKKIATVVVQHLNLPSIDVDDIEHIANQKQSSN